MRRLLALPLLTAALGVLCLAAPARAALTVVFGQSWDGPSHTLQSVIDARYGAGKISVQTDYIGAKPGDLDPWFWVDKGFSALIVTEIAGYATSNVVGWYIEPEDGQRPLIDGVDDGVAFDGPAGTGATAVITFSKPRQKFGFYLRPPYGQNRPVPVVYFTNRLFNDRGPNGTGAVHAPWDGDVQAIVYDVSRWTQPNTWLVCWEDLDSGPMPGPPGTTTDNDFNDFVFEVHAMGATPASSLTFGGLKLLYH